MPGYNCPLSMLLYIVLFSSLDLNFEALVLFYFGFSEHFGFSEPEVVSRHVLVKRPKKNYKNLACC